MDAVPDLVAERIRREHGAVAFDIGAHVGKYTTMLAENFAQVYAFEPDPRNLFHLRGNTAHLRNVEVLPVAISNYSGQCTLNLSNYSEANSLRADILTIPGLGWSLIARQEVLCTSIDDFCARRNVAVNFIKMDIESGEEFAWEGAHATLARGVRIMLEVHRTVDVARLERLFRDHGYGWEIGTLPNVHEQQYFLHKVT